MSADEKDLVRVVENLIDPIIDGYYGDALEGVAEQVIAAVRTHDAEAAEYPVERRIIVKGWKGATRKEFTDVSPLYSDSTIEFERARIGEQGLPNWQPHITEVLVEERTVTPWKQVDR